MASSVNLASPTRPISATVSLLISSLAITEWMRNLSREKLWPYGVQVSDEPTANSTSQLSSHWRAGPVVDETPAPRASGWRSSIADLPGIDVNTGTSSNSAKVRSSSQAPAVMTPEPAQINGSSASTSFLAASAIAPAGGAYMAAVGDE